MGKIPPSFRSAITASNMIRSPTIINAEQPRAPGRHFPKKKPQLSRKIPKDESNSAEISTNHHFFKSDNLKDAKIVVDIMSSTVRDVDVRFHNSVLRSYASISSTVDDCVSLFQHMINKIPAFSPQRSTYHILLTQACNSHDFSAVHKILNLMVKNGFEPNQVTTDIAVRSLCLAGMEDDAVALIKEFARKNSPPDTYTYNFLVKHLCKCRALDTVYTFMDTMRTDFDIKPDLVSYTILIDNVCNTKNLREVTRLMGVLKYCGVKPDRFLYNTIMKGYCMLSRGTEAMGLYNKMKDEGIEPDLVTYNTLIFGLSKSGRVKEAKKILKVMVEKGHFPDAVTYTSLMNGMCRESDTLGALALLKEMEARGCSANACTYNTLLHGLCKSRLLDKGIECYEAIKAENWKLDSSSYGTFVRALCREGKIAEAYEVFDYAIESKSLSDAAAYSTLETTLKWLKKAREEGLAV
ncbi:hypothetical protein ACFE04_026615 [Oxalis oulophora]